VSEVGFVLMLESGSSSSSAASAALLSRCGALMGDVAGGAGVYRIAEEAHAAAGEPAGAGLVKPVAGSADFLQGCNSVVRGSEEVLQVDGNSITSGVQTGCKGLVENDNGSLQSLERLKVEIPHSNGTQLDAPALAPAPGSRGARPGQSSSGATFQPQLTANEVNGSHQGMRSPRPDIHNTVKARPDKFKTTDRSDARNRAWPMSERLAAEKENRQGAHRSSESLPSSRRNSSQGNGSEGSHHKRFSSPVARSFSPVGTFKLGTPNTPTRRKVPKQDRQTFQSKSHTSLQRSRSHSQLLPSTGRKKLGGLRFQLSPEIDNGETFSRSHLSGEVASRGRCKTETLPKVAENTAAFRYEGMEEEDERTPPPFGRAHSLGISSHGLEIGSKEAPDVYGSRAQRIRAKIHRKDTVLWTNHDVEDATMFPLSPTGASRKPPSQRNRVLALQPKKKWLQGALLGGGTFGKVYAGFDCVTGEQFAVKRIPMDPDNVAETQKLMSEIDVMRVLGHKNIVNYIAHQIVEETRGERHFLEIFMEIVPGGTMKERYKLQGPLPESIIAKWGYQITCGLHYLHQNRIIHRDVKADNVLISNAGNAMVSDFGTSRKTDMLATGDGTFKEIRGSIPWMAPEMVRQDGVTATCDVWSLGCTLLEGLTAKSPWGFQDDQKYFAFLTIGSRTEIPPMSGVKDGPLRNLILRCFVIDPSKRPSTEELLEDPLFRSFRD